MAPNAVLRAKLRVQSISQQKDDKGAVTLETINLTAVYSPDESDENHQWSKWTPSASFNMTISNPNAFGKLSSGHEFFVDFIPCEPNREEAVAR